MAGRTFLDSNVLVYMFDGKYPGKREKARSTYAGLERGQVVVSTQVLQEFFWNVTRKLSPPVPEDVAVGCIRDFSAHTVVVIELDTVFAAIARASSARIAFWDGLIVEAALSAGCTRLLTEDLQDGREFDGMRVVNPFAVRE